MSAVQAAESSETIKAYDQFRTELTRLEAENAATTFDYTNPEDNRAARSHVFKLRKVRTAVDKARKSEKEESLEYGRRVDAEAKEIMGRISAMIDVHAIPLKEIEDKERARVAAHEKACRTLEDFALIANQGDSVDVYRTHIAALKAMEPDESYEEFMAAAVKYYKASLATLEEGLALAVKREEEEAELQKLRQEKAERERIEREKQIAREATEKAEREAKENAERLEREKQQAIRDAEEAKERAEREKVEAEERQRKAVAEAEAKAKRAAEEKIKREEEEAKKREADKKHRAAVDSAAVDALVNGGISKAAAKEVITLIAKQSIPNVVIRY